MSSNTTEIDLKPFCARDEGRYTLIEPFVRRGFRYATDGRIAVRVPVPDEPDTTGRQFPPIEDKFPDVEESAWQPWPDTNITTGQVDCTTCDGNGLVNTKPCKVCDGYGSHSCPDCSEEHDCGKCDGNGFLSGSTCPSCAGKGSVQGPKHQAIADRHVKGNYMILIRSLPNVQFFAVPGEKSPIRFRFDGGDGVVMPVVLSPDVPAARAGR